MSSALAIASVTAVLRDLLINGLIDHDLTPSVGDVKVTALPPDRITTGDQEQSQLNLFLYQVTPNLGWRNVGLPSRNSQGQSIAGPPLALDLHYLLTAYGARDFHAEILLGYAMQLFHDTPVLAREAIRIALGPVEPASAGGGLPATLAALSASALADQVEQIKICPQHLNTEETSKLWTALQARYRATAAYQVSVVLIESRQPVRPSLPVLSRGKGDRGVEAQAGGNLPVIQELRLPHSQSSALLNDEVILVGQNLEGFAAVRFTNYRLTDPFEITVPDAQETGGQIKVALQKNAVATLPNGATIPAPWVAGSYAVAAVVDRNGRRWSSNEWHFSLAPRIEKIAPPNPVARDGNGNVTLTLTCSPPIRLAPVNEAAMRFDQQVELLLGSRRPISPRPPAAPPAPPAAPPAGTDQLTFVFPMADAEVGGYLPRLRVDGVEMPLVDWSVPQPRFDLSHQVTIT